MAAREEPRAHGIAIASQDEAPALAQLQVDFAVEFDDPTPPFDVLEPRFRRLIADPAAFAVIAVGDRRALGYALVTLRPTVYFDGPLAVLDELYVVPDRRGGGIGTDLLEEAIRELRRRGGREMHINVDDVDADARRFYERHGFVNVEPVRRSRMLMYLREFD